MFKGHFKVKQQCSCVSQVSANLQHMEGFLEKRDQLLPGRQQVETNAITLP